MTTKLEMIIETMFDVLPMEGTTAELTEKIERRMRDYTVSVQEVRNAIAATRSDPAAYEYMVPYVGQTRYLFAVMVDPHGEWIFDDTPEARAAFEAGSITAAKNVSTRLRVLATEYLLAMKQTRKRNLRDRYEDVAEMMSFLGKRIDRQVADMEAAA